MKRLPISPYMMAGVLAVLLPVFTIMTLDRVERQKAQIKEQFLVKGVSLLRTLEAGTRTGMLTMRWGTMRIQAMLTETAVQPDVDYIMITTAQGRILAHSDPEMTGRTVQNFPRLDPFQADTSQTFHRVLTAPQDPEKEVVLEVYKPFTPLSIGFKGRHRPMHKDRHSPHRPNGAGPGMAGPDMAGPDMPGCAGGADHDRVPDMPAEWRQKADPYYSTGLYIFAGLSLARVNQIHEHMAKSVIGRSVLFFVAGCVGVIGLFAFQAYRAAKASLNRVQAFSDHLVQTMPAGLVTLDRENRVTSVNRAAAQILGHTPDKAYPQMLALAGELAAIGRSITREITLTPDGRSSLRLDMTASPIWDDGGRIQGYLFLFRDLTQIRQLKKEVETTRHLAAIGKLAGGVAHEIRNPLSSIKGFATYLGTRFSKGSDDAETARIMVQEVERINRSITQLLEFAKPMAVEVRPVEIAPLIRHSLKLVSHDLERKQIKAIVEIRTAQSHFSTDPDRINQVLLNLYMNAVNAMDDRGCLTVTVQDVAGDRVSDADGIEIRVHDNGAGIEKKDLADIFDPYFTTRPDGTGLGLSIVHRIVENLSGEIRVESAPGQGSCFTVRLPGPENGGTREDKQ